jgi:hypothetical protein
MLPLKNRETALRIAPSWMKLYAYTLFIDDVLDSKKSADLSQSLLASALLLERGISELATVFPRRANIRVKLDKYFLEAAQATFKEITKHRERLDKYSEEDIARLGEKVALLKLCASCLLAADGAQHSESELLIPVESLATGAQLFDDVTDWKEDWRAGNYSYLLTRTFHQLARSGISRPAEKLSSIEVLLGIVITRSLEDCLARGLEYLKTVEMAPHLKDESPAKHFLKELIQQHDAFVDEVVETRKYLRHSRVSLGKPNTDWLKQLAMQQPVRKQIELIGKRLTILANST